MNRVLMVVVFRLCRYGLHEFLACQRRVSGPRLWCGFHKTSVLGTHPVEGMRGKNAARRRECPLREGIFKRNAQTVRLWLAPGESVPLDKDSKRDLCSSPWLPFPPGYTSNTQPGTTCTIPSRLLP